MLPNGEWEISPAYDLCFSYDKKSKWIALQQMTCNGKRDDFNYNDLKMAAKQAEISNYKTIIKDVKDAVSLWPDFAKQAGLPESETKNIQGLFRNIEVPLKLN